MLPAGAGGQAVVDLGEGAAEASDVDGRLRQPPLSLEKMELREEFLGLAHGKDGHEHRAALCEGLLDRHGQPFDLTRRA